jgi:hypothetical protein
VKDAGRRTLTDLELEEHIRRTLTTVAATVPEGPAQDALPGSAPPLVAPDRRLRRGRRVLVAAGVAAVALALAAFVHAHIGPEYVDKLPPDDVLQTVSADGDVYWLVPSVHRDPCGRRQPGVEVVSRSRNLVGREWSTAGLVYGGDIRMDQRGCVQSGELDGWIDNPGRASIGYQRAGTGEDGDWLATIGAHPTARQLVVTWAGGKLGQITTNALPNDPTGPRYAVVVVPKNVRHFDLTLYNDEGARIGTYSAVPPEHPSSGGFR